MQDNSPVLLRIKEGTQPYHFFIFTITIFRAALSSSNFLEKIEEAEKDQALDLPPLIESITNVAEKLLAAPEDSESVIPLSVIDVSSLLSAVDMISKALLTDESDIIITSVQESLPSVEPHWESNYLKSAQLLFGQLKDKLSILKNYDTLLSFITRHQM